MRDKDRDGDGLGIVCLRALLDARVIPYLHLATPRIEAMPAGSAKVREAASLVRRLRGGWLGLGTYARDGVAHGTALAHVARWRAAGLSDHVGEATLVSVIVLSRTALLLEGIARTGDEARAELEALSSAQVENVVDVELVADGRLLRADDAFITMTDPPLRVVATEPGVFCPRCGVPLTPLAAELARCLECGTPLVRRDGVELSA